MATKTCPECGMEQTEWPDVAGFTKDGVNFCCQGCAEGTGCICGGGTLEHANDAAGVAGDEESV